MHNWIKGYIEGGRDNGNCGNTKIKLSTDFQKECRKNKEDI